MALRLALRRLASRRLAERRFHDAPVTQDTTPPILSTAAPTDVTATGATISWTTNEPAATILTYQPEGGSAVTVTDTTLSTSHAVTLTGLLSSTLYTYTAGARDAAGNLATSAEQAFTTLTPADTTPSVISSISSGTPASTAATVTWTTDEAASSIVDIGFDTSYGTTITDTALVTSHSVPLTNLAPNTLYHWRARSIDGSGNQGTSADQTFTTASSADTTPPVVTSPSQTTTGSTATVIATTDEPCVISVAYGTTTGYGSTATDLLTYRTRHSFVIENLTPSQLYHYQTTFTDAAGNQTVSADRTWTTLDTVPPIISSIVPTGLVSSVSITWTTNEASDTQIEWGLTTSYGQSTVLSSAPVTNHGQSITGLDAGTLYHYRVKSRDAAGNLATSTDQTFTTAAPAPDEWADTAPPSGATVDAITTLVTEESIGCWFAFTEGATTLTLATAEFRFSDGTNRRDALDFCPVRNETNTTKRVIGSILLLTKATAYQIRVRLFWSDGTSSYRIVTATTADYTSITPNPTTLTPTWYVDPVNGNDANNGSSPALAKKTLLHVMQNYSVGTNPVVKFLSNGNKVYTTSNGNTQLNRGAARFITDAPVVSDVTAAGARPTVPPVSINTSGGRVTVEPPYVTAPTGYVPTYDTWVTVAPWTQVSLAGPGEAGNTPGTLYSVWTWTPTANAMGAATTLSQAAYGATRDQIPVGRLATWPMGAMSSAAGFAEWLWTNLGYRYGFYTHTDGAIYCRLPGDLDPNTQWLWFGTGNAFWGSSGGLRVSGFSIHTFEVAIYNATVADHNATHVCWKGVRFDGSVSGRLCERNALLDSNLWTIQALQPNPYTASWNFIKSGVTGADNTTHLTRALRNESAGVTLTSGAYNCVARRNWVNGPFDGPGAFGTSQNTFSLQASNTDFYENYIERTADDAFEIEQSTWNVRIWFNNVRETVTGLSIAPIHWGPVYYFRNTVWETGSAGLGKNTDGSNTANGKGVKFSNGSRPRARVYYLHNSVDIDQNDPNLVMFAGDSGGGSTRHEGLYLKNNIITASSYVIDSEEISPADGYVEDYNFLGTAEVTRGIRLRAVEGSGALTDYDNTSSALRFANYRAASGRGMNSNLIDAVTKEINAAQWITDLRAMWTNRTTGDLTLVAGAQAINRGTPLPNLSDRPGIDYLGTAPDLGAIEKS